MQLKDFSIASLVGCRVVRDIPEDNSLRLPLLPELFTGIEIEAEGVVFDSDSTFDPYQMVLQAGWRMDNDGSLRRDGVEFVLADPLNGSRLSRSVETLMDLHDAQEVVWRGSPRAGTHFHLNVSDKNVGFLQSMAALMFCVDELMFKYAGEDRKWCSYCNSLNTLPFTVLRALLGQTGEVADERRMSWHSLWPMVDGDRYYGFNIAAVSKYGTVELRYFQTPESKEQLWEWLDLCHLLYQVAEEFEDEEHPAQAVTEAMVTRPLEILQKLRFLDTSEDAVTSVLEAAEELTHIILSEMVTGDEDAEATVQLDALARLIGWRPRVDAIFNLHASPSSVQEDASEGDGPDINTLAS